MLCSSNIRNDWKTLGFSDGLRYRNKTEDNRMTMSQDNEANHYIYIKSTFVRLLHQIMRFIQLTFPSCSDILHTCVCVYIYIYIHIYKIYKTHI